MFDNTAQWQYERKNETNRHPSVRKLGNYYLKLLFPHPPTPGRVFQPPSARYPFTDLKLQHVCTLTRVLLLHRGSGSSEERQVPEPHQCSAWWPPCWCGHLCLEKTSVFSVLLGIEHHRGGCPSRDPGFQHDFAAHHISVKFTYFSWWQSHTVYV